MKTIAFFNNKGGVGKTSLVYHLAWMYADLGVRVVAADLDPQANLTRMFLDEERLEQLWPDGPHPNTVFGAIQPLLEGTGDVNEPYVEHVTDNLGLIVSDLALFESEDELNGQWSDWLHRNPRAFRVLSAFWRVTEAAAREMEAGLVLIDLAPNLGAVNRAALIAATNVVIPLAPDLFSLKGLKNLGPTLRRWREEWAESHSQGPVSGLSLPDGEMQASGYVVLQHAGRLDQKIKAYDSWMARIPSVYCDSVLGKSASEAPKSIAEDPYCLAILKPFRSLMPLAQQARKPMFFLRPADGAIGGHAQAVQDCYRDFRSLAQAIARRCGVPLP